MCLIDSKNSFSKITSLSNNVSLSPLPTPSNHCSTYLTPFRFHRKRITQSSFLYWLTSFNIMFFILSVIVNCEISFMKTEYNPVCGYITDQPLSVSILALSLALWTWFKHTSAVTLGTQLVSLRQLTVFCSLFRSPPAAVTSDRSK